MANMLEFKRGDTWEATFTYRDDTGALINLTSCSARMQMRDKRSGTLLLDLTSSDSLTMGGAAGTVDMLVAPDLTREMPVGTFEVDLEITYSDGTVQSSDTFSIKVWKDITHD